MDDFLCFYKAFFQLEKHVCKIYGNEMSKDSWENGFHFFVTKKAI